MRPAWNGNSVKPFIFSFHVSRFTLTRLPNCLQSISADPGQLSQVPHARQECFVAEK